MIPTQFKESSNFHEGLAAVRPIGKDYDWGFINKKGEMVIPPIYRNNFYNLRFSEELASVSDPEGNETSMGYISKTGEVKIPYKYAYTKNFKGGYADYFQGIQDTDIRESSNHLCINKKGNKVSNKFCKSRIKRVFDPKGIISVDKASDNFLEVIGQLKPSKDEKTGKYGYIDDNRKLIIPYQFDEASYFSEGLAMVYK
jgi:hypothetical protein